MNASLMFDIDHHFRQPIALHFVGRNVTAEIN